MLQYCSQFVLKNVIGLLFVLCPLYLLIQIFVYKDGMKSKYNLPILNWWTPFFPGDDRITECEHYNCHMTNNKTHPNIKAFLFYGSHVENDNLPLPRNVKIPWAIFHEESPKNYAPFLFSDVQHLFNVTSTFSRYSDFPVTLQHLSKNELSIMKDKQYYVSVRNKNQYLGKNAPVLYVQSDCDTPIGRDYLVEELSKYVKIDSFGSCLKNKDFPEDVADIDSLDLYNEKYLKFISKYKFTIAFENAICDDYITEKLWRPLAVGSVPIYLGSPTVEDWLPNKNSAILVKNFESMKHLGEFLNRVNADDSLYETFLDHKIHERISNEALYRNILQDHSVSAFECYVCERIHRDGARSGGGNAKNVYDCPKPSSIGGNTWHQHWEVGRCQAKALKRLVERGRSFSQEQFEEMWTGFYQNKGC